MTLHARTRRVSMHPRHAHFKGQAAEKANPTCRRRSVHCNVRTSFTSSALRVSSYGYRGILEKPEINTDVYASRRENWRIWLELKHRLSAICGFCCVQCTHVSYRAPRHLSYRHRISPDSSRFAGILSAPPLPAPRDAHAHWLPVRANPVSQRGAVLLAPAKSCFPGRPLLPFSARSPQPRARTRFRSCEAGASVSSSPRSRGGCAAAGRAPGRPPWPGSGWRWTAGSWKG